MTSEKITNRDLFNLANDINEKIDLLEDKIDANYVHKNEFLPVKNIVYGMVGLILTSVAVAVVAQVVRAIR